MFLTIKKYFWKIGKDKTHVIDPDAHAYTQVFMVGIGLFGQKIKISGTNNQKMFEKFGTISQKEGGGLRSEWFSSQTVCVDVLIFFRSFLKMSHQYHNQHKAQSTSSLDSNKLHDNTTGGWK